MCEIFFHGKSAAARAIKQASKQSRSRDSPNPGQGVCPCRANPYRTQTRVSRVSYFRNATLRKFERRPSRVSFSSRATRTSRRAFNETSLRSTFLVESYSRFTAGSQSLSLSLCLSFSLSLSRARQLCTSQSNEAFTLNAAFDSH